MSFVIDSLNDSRCQPGMMCFWAGQVILYMNISTGGSLMDTTFYLGNSGMKPVIIGGYSFKADSVYPISAGTTKSKEITVKMTIIPAGS